MALSRHALSHVCLDVELPTVADVGEVRGDRADPSPAAGHLDHDLRRSPYGAADLLDLGAREATRAVRASATAAEDIEEGLAAGRRAKRAPSHDGSPS